jgi:hypothetical protein
VGEEEILASINTSPTTGAPVRLWAAIPDDIRLGSSVDQLCGRRGGQDGQDGSDERRRLEVVECDCKPSHYG